MADYVRAAVETAIKIHEEDLPGDILIFLTGVRWPAASVLVSTSLCPESTQGRRVRATG